MAKKKQFNAVEQVLAIDAAVDAGEPLGETLNQLAATMESWPAAAKRLSRGQLKGRPKGAADKK